MAKALPVSTSLIPSTPTRGGGQGPPRSLGSRKPWSCFANAPSRAAQAELCTPAFIGNSPRVASAWRRGLSPAAAFRQVGFILGNISPGLLRGEQGAGRRVRRRPDLGSRAHLRGAHRGRRPPEMPPQVPLLAAPLGPGVAESLSVSPSKHGDKQILCLHASKPLG